MVAGMSKQDFKLRARKALDPATNAFASMGVPPIAVSLLGLAISIWGAVVVSEGRLFLGALLLLLAGFCDVIDGDLARLKNATSRFGAFIDSTLDRVTEFAYFGAILFYTVNRPVGFRNYEIVVVFIALAGSVLTSYARARAEGVGLECKVGILERPERVAALTLGLILGYRVLIFVMTVLAVGTMYTFLQRIAHVYRIGSEEAATEPPPTADE